MLLLLDGRVGAGGGGSGTLPRKFEPEEREEGE